LAGPLDNAISVLQRLAENHDLDELAGCVVVVTDGLIQHPLA
jgi:hypothetical protein